MRLIQKQLLLPIGIVLFLAGMGLTFYNVTGEREWHVGEGTDLVDSSTWTIRDQSIGFATPWNYDLGALPENAHIDMAFNVTTVETRSQISRPGINVETSAITDLDTGDVYTPEFDRYTLRVNFIIPRASRYRYTVQSVRGTLLTGWTYDTTPVEFDACIQAYTLGTSYPYRVIGGLLIAVGVALSAYSKIRR